MPAASARHSKHLELEGIVPEPADDGVLNEGRLGVFLAKGDFVFTTKIHGEPAWKGWRY